MSMLDFNIKERIIPDVDPTSFLGKLERFGQHTANIVSHAITNQYIYLKDSNSKNSATGMLNEFNKILKSVSPDINGYVFCIILPPDLSGLSADVNASVQKVCTDATFFSLDFTPPNITINTESINTQASISMPYATTKIATGEMSISYLDDSDMNINSMHNLWVEYLYNQLWGDFPPNSDYITPGNPKYGALDYATTIYVLKYNANVGASNGVHSTPTGFIPSMVGKAVGVFPLGVPVKETIGVRTSNDLVIESINYTCSYYETVHPKSLTQTYSQNIAGDTILDEIDQILKNRYNDLYTVV